MSTIRNFRETASWFSDLARNANKVKKAYLKADKLTEKASKSTEKALLASKKANLLAEEVLGGSMTANDPATPIDNFEELVPLVVTDDSNHKRLWAEWFASIQEEIDMESQQNHSGDDDEE